MKINGQKLKRYREVKGYSLRELAILTGVSMSTLEKWEVVPTANPFPSKLRIVTSKLGISIHDISLNAPLTSETKHANNNYYEIQLDAPRDYLKCLRNELRPDNKKTEYGLLGYLQYKLDNEIEYDPDSMYIKYNKFKKCFEGTSRTAEIFKEIYGKSEESSDTVFNVWSFFRMFIETRTKESPVMKLDEDRKPIFENIGGIDGAQGDLEALFKGYEDILELLNEFADLHHCLANMMPAPIGYNGCPGHDGKGNYERDNDMPDIYYKRAEKDFPRHYQWIQDNKEDYCLNFFEEYKSPWTDGCANQSLNLDDADAVMKYKIAIVDAINCIYHRSIELYKLRMERKHK